jgi:chromosome condensin MukBEF complex kleisin-like MukF subunit
LAEEERHSMIPSDVEGLVKRLREANAAVLKAYKGDGKPALSELFEESASTLESLQAQLSLANEKITAQNIRIGEQHMALSTARADALEEAAKVALSAKLPKDYQWGHDAMESFDFGKERAATAIHSLADQAPKPGPA